nr:EOG090X0IQO [Macrothrix elegans]
MLLLELFVELNCKKNTMPAYELSLIVRSLARPELISSLKRAAETVVQQGGVLRQFHFLGKNPLPNRMKAHNVWHTEGNYFIMKFDAPSSSLEILNDELRRDIDLVRSHVVKLEEPVKFECTLEEESKPPAYRKSVQKLIEEGRKVERPMYKQNTPGFDYYPFQK